MEGYDRRDVTTSSSKGRVLIIDDDQDFADALASLLNREIYDIEIVHSGVDARKVLHRFDAQVSLIDVRLGREDGINLIGDLRVQRPDLRCVIMTAYAELDNAIAAIQEGAFDYLRKPLDEADLFATMERCFEWIRMIREKAVAEEALRESEERFRSLVENVPGVIYRCVNDRHRGMQIISDMIEEVSGFTTSDFLSDPSFYYSQIIHQDDRDRVWDLAQEALSRDEPFSLEYRIIDSNGQERWVLDRGRGIKGEDGRIQMIDGALFDISDRKKAERDREWLQSQLFQSQKMEALGQMAGGIAHDFNNYLTAIIGNAELAQFRAEKGQESAEEINGVLWAAEQATSISRALLTFSRKSLPEITLLDLGRFLKDSIAILRRMLPASIEVTVSCTDGEELWVKVDSVQLNQVVMNLVVNARDAMPDGGLLQVLARREELEPDQWLSITTREIGAAVLEIIDNGVGMKEDVLARVCDPFFTTKPREQGTGLGMAVVHGIVEAHGGQMKIESQPGRGTRVAIALPRSVSSLTTGDDLNMLSSYQKLEATVLLADDNSSVRTAMTSALEAAGCEVIQAKDGAEAFALFEEHREKIDVAVLDIDMPHLRGNECLEQIQSIRQDFPAILISGFIDITTKIEPSELIKTIRKPFLMADIIATMSVLLESAARKS